MATRTGASKVSSRCFRYLLDVCQRVPGNLERFPQRVFRGPDDVCASPPDMFSRVSTSQQFSVVAVARFREMIIKAVGVPASMFAGISEVGESHQIWNPEMVLQIFVYSFPVKRFFYAILGGGEVPAICNGISWRGWVHVLHSLMQMYKKLKCILHFWLPFDSRGESSCIFSFLQDRAENPRHFKAKPVGCENISKRLLWLSCCKTCSQKKLVTKGFPHQPRLRLRLKKFAQVGKSGWAEILSVSYLITKVLCSQLEYLEPSCAHRRRLSQRSTLLSSQTTTSKRQVAVLRKKI